MATITNTNLFVPTQISGCSLWLDAADPATVVTSGNSVTAWNDKSGNANNSSGVTGTVSYSSNLITFSGNLNTSFISYPSFPFSLSNMTVFAVVRFTSSYTYPTDANFYFANFFESTGATPMRFAFTRFNSAPYSWILNYYTGGGATNGQGLINFSGAGGPSGLTYLFTIQNTNNTYTQFSSGSNINTTTVTGFTPTTPANFSVGTGANGIQVGELIFFQNSALNTQQRQQVEGYLAWKWNLQRNLPATHPFFNNPVLPNLPIPQLITPFTQTNVIQPVTSPLQVSGCALWLDAADSTSVVLSGSNVTQWNDKSGNGRNATGIATRYPTYDSTNRRITFDGTNQYLSNIGFSVNLSQRSIFIVFQQLVYTIYTGVLPIIPSPTSGFDYLTTNGMTIETSGGLRFYQNSAAYQNDILTTQPLQLGIYYEQMNGTAGTTFRNATLSSNATSGFTSGSCGGYALGCRWSGAPASPYLNGYMNEILIYNTPITTDQRQQIEGYLAWKWGLQASLPTNHPYYFNSLVPNLVLQSQTLSMSRAVGFQPNQVSGLSLWLDAADPNTVIRTGTSVTQWNDKSSNGRNFTANGATNPIYTNNVINSNSALTFNGTNQNLANTTLVFPNSAYTIFTIHYLLSLTGNTPNGFQRVLTASIEGGIFVGVASTGNTAVFTGNALGNGTWNDTNAITPAITNLGSWLIVGYTVSSTLLTPYVNGTMYNTKTGTTGAFTGLNIGTGIPYTTGQGWNGFIGEILIFNSALNTQGRQQIEGYLAWKWGLQANLPSSHPFSLFPPG